MSNELSIDTAKLISAVENKDVGEILKPLVTRIHLFDTYISGIGYVEEKDVYLTVNQGDRLILRRDPNKFDDNAIVILTKDNRKLGYIPEKDELIFARLMDAGKLLEGIIDTIKEEKNRSRMIRIGIYLVDY